MMPLVIVVGRHMSLVLCLCFYGSLAALDENGQPFSYEILLLSVFCCTDLLTKVKGTRGNKAKPLLY